MKLYIFSNTKTVLQPENATDVSDVDFSKCGANYCPQYEEDSSNVLFIDSNPIIIIAHYQS